MYLPLIVWFHETGDKAASMPFYKYAVPILLTFTMCGLWHGANMTFVVWGFINGIYLLPVRSFYKQRSGTAPIESWTSIPQFKDIFKIITVFFMFTASLIFARSVSVRDAINYFGGLFSKSFFSSPVMDLNMGGLSSSIIDGSIGLAVLITAEWLQRDKQHPLELDRLPALFRWGVYTILVILIFLYFVSNDKKTFIYFQF